MVLVSCTQLTGMLQWGMRQSAEMENLMTSAERILEYGRLESEAPLRAEGDPPPAGRDGPGGSPPWPGEGRVEFREVTLRYGGRAALRGVSFATGAAEKVRDLLLTSISSPPPDRTRARPTRAYFKDCVATIAVMRISTTLTS